MKLMCKIDKILNWVLGIFFILFIITGFDIQRRFFFPQISSLIHLEWIVLPALIAFGFHTVYKISIRIRTEDKYYILKRVLLGAYTGFIIWMIGYFIYYKWIL